MSKLNCLNILISDDSYASLFEFLSNFAGTKNIHISRINRIEVFRCSETVLKSIPANEIHSIIQVKPYYQDFSNFRLLKLYVDLDPTLGVIGQTKQTKIAILADFKSFREGKRLKQRSVTSS